MARNVMAVLSPRVRYEEVNGLSFVAVRGSSLTQTGTCRTVVPTCLGLEPINPLRIDSAEDFMARVWNTPVFILATVYFVVDGGFSHVTQPITVWLFKKKPFGRARL